MALIDLRLHGPCELFGDASIFAAADAWRPGVFLWTFLFNQSDRIHRIGYANDSVAQMQARLVGQLLGGDLPLHDIEARLAGELTVVHRPAASIDDHPLRDSIARAELAALRVFYAPLDDAAAGVRIAGAIARHFFALGGKARGWLASDLAEPPPALASAAELTVRFYRPVLMVSMPDELSA